MTEMQLKATAVSVILAGLHTANHLLLMLIHIAVMTKMLLLFITESLKTTRSFVKSSQRAVILLSHRLIQR